MAFTSFGSAIALSPIKKSTDYENPRLASNSGVARARRVKTARRLIRRDVFAAQLAAAHYTEKTAPESDVRYSEGGPFRQSEWMPRSKKKMREHAPYLPVFCRERENRGLVGGARGIEPHTPFTLESSRVLRFCRTD
jgi:hypothetical protein